MGRVSGYFGFMVSPALWVFLALVSVSFASAPVLAEEEAL